MSDVWEMFSQAQHLHFEKGDVLVLTTKERLHPGDLDRVREEISKISDCVTVMVIEPELQLSKVSR